MKTSNFYGTISKMPYLGFLLAVYFFTTGSMELGFATVCMVGLIAYAYLNYAVSYSAAVLSQYIHKPAESMSKIKSVKDLPADTPEEIKEIVRAMEKVASRKNND